jgi:hypothetical protein
MTYYRYNDDSFDYEDNIRIILNSYEVLSETKCGVWIRFPERDRYLYSPMKYIQGKKFILTKIYSYPVYKCPNKCFAWPTKELALISYIARKEKQIAILENQLENAKEFLAKAKEMQNGQKIS